MPKKGNKMFKNIEKITTEILNSVSSLESTYEQYDDLDNNFKCPKCRDSGWILIIEKDGCKSVKDCECRVESRIKYNLKKSGLENLVHRYNLYNFNADKTWQQKILSEAYRFINDDNRQWLYIGGQVGSGKTHICIAISYEFLKRGLHLRYVTWRETISELKHFLVNDNEKYFEFMRDLKTADVLFIDDLFKSERNTRPTTWEINVLYEIIDYRYRGQGLITLFSSEMSINEVLDIDEATGSRILERTKSYYIYISSDYNKNLRINNFI